MTQPTAAPPPIAPKKTSRLAIVAFILSLLICLPPIALIGSLLGVISLIRLGQHREMGGFGLSIAAIALGAVSVVVGGILAAIAIPNFIAFQARSKQSEAKSNLEALYTAERSYAMEHGDAFTSDMVAIGFSPERGNRYAYFLAPSGPTEVRSGVQASIPAHPVILGVDRFKFEDARALPTVAATHCPVALQRSDGGPSLQVGLSGSGASAAFVAVAAGNIDGDPTLDCWSISNVARVTSKGKTIPAGQPFNDQDDVDY